MARKSNSRTARWEKAVKRAVEAETELTAALEELKEVQQEYQDWYDNMSDNLRSGATGDKLETITSFDFDIDLSVIGEAEAADLPLGFGRD
jgi:hypothetical protein